MCIRDSPPEAPPVHAPASFIARFGICANNGAESTSPELGGPLLRALLGPRSSRFESVPNYHKSP
eukprot:3805292-Alexandrium_andersonii.AAC.1